MRFVRIHNGEETVSAKCTHPMIRDNFYILEQVGSAILYVINTREYMGIAWVLASMLPALRDQCHVSRE